MDKIQVVYVDIDNIKGYENNAKRHPQEQIEQIKKSIQLYGMNDPIALWKNNEIIEGHGRLQACRELELTQVPCFFLDKLTDKERREYMLVHNQTTMNTGWDFEKLEAELEDLDFDGFDFGFDSDEVDSYIDSFFEEGDASTPKEPTFRLMVEFDDEIELNASYESMKEAGYKVKKL